VPQSEGAGAGGGAGEGIGGEASDKMACTICFNEEKEMDGFQCHGVELHFLCSGCTIDLVKSSCTESDGAGLGGGAYLLHSISHSNTDSASDVM
jgi:hypothetical protein